MRERCAGALAIALTMWPSAASAQAARLDAAVIERQRPEAALSVTPDGVIALDYDCVDCGFDASIVVVRGRSVATEIVSVSSVQPAAPSPAFDGWVALELLATISFRSPITGDFAVEDIVSSAFYLCGKTGCERHDWTDYAVAIGIAKKAILPDGSYSIEMPLEDVPRNAKKDFSGDEAVVE